MDGAGPVHVLFERCKSEAPYRPLVGKAVERPGETVEAAGGNVLGALGQTVQGCVHTASTPVLAAPSPFDRLRVEGH